MLRRDIRKVYIVVLQVEILLSAIWVIISTLGGQRCSSFMMMCFSGIEVAMLILLGLSPYIIGVNIVLYLVFLGVQKLKLDSHK
jgi:hypothetical protein